MNLTEFYNKHKVKIYLILNIVILLAMALFMLLTANRQSLWLDELRWTMGYVQGGFFEMLSSLSTTLYNLPLFYIVGFFTYKIFPVGEIWLMLPSIIFVICGVWFLYLTIKNLYGFELATLASFIASVSLVLISFAGLQFRPYALMFMLVCLCLYFYQKRLSNPSIKNILLLGVMYLLLAYTHWFGILFVAVLGVYDFVLCCIKKQTFKVLISYVIAVVLFIPWFLVAVINSVYSLTDYWASKPTLKYPMYVISAFTNGNIVFSYMFFLGYISYIVQHIVALLKKENFANKRITLLFSIIIPIVFALVMFYSGVINPSGSLCVDRYFIIIFPFVVFFTAYFVYFLFCIIKKFIKRQLISNIIIGLILMLIVPYMFYSSYSLALKQKYMVPNEMYGEVATYLDASGDMEREDVVLLQIDSSDVWLKYYVGNKGDYSIQNYYTHCFSKEIDILVKDGNKTTEKTDPIGLLEDIEEFNIVYLFYDHPSGIDLNDNYLYNELILDYDLELVYHNLYKFTKKA